MLVRRITGCSWNKIFREALAEYFIDNISDLSKDYLIMLGRKTWIVLAGASRA